MKNNNNIRLSQRVIILAELPEKITSNDKNNRAYHAKSEKGTSL